jgi:hypothetical protein
MESQGRLPLQSGGGGGPWAFGADDENGSLLQVTRETHRSTTELYDAGCIKRLQ